MGEIRCESFTYSGAKPGTAISYNTTSDKNTTVTKLN